MNDSEDENLWDKVRIRNLKINIVKVLIDKKKLIIIDFLKQKLKIGLLLRNMILNT